MVSVPARSLHTAVYDAALDRVLVFGGATNGKTTRDLLSLSLSSPDASWQPMPTLGSGPSSRCSHASALDPTRGVMLVFGGTAGIYSGPLADAWLLDVGGGMTWQAVSPSGPRPPGGPAAAVYDPVGDRFVVWSGDQVWALSLGGGPAWVPIQSHAPLVSPGDPPPVAVKALYDGARRRVLVLASGYDGGSALNLSDGAWTNPWPVHANSPRPFGAVIDSAGDRLLCFGGPSNIDRSVWERPLGSTGGTWSLVSGIAGTAPLGRCDQAAVYDPVRRSMVFYGGADYDVYPFNDTWALDLGATPAWRTLSAVPEARQSPMAAYDVGSDRLVLFSGFPTGPEDNDTWLMDLESGRWRALDPDAVAPPARSGGSMVYDPPNHRILLFGGGGATDYDDLWALSLDGEPTWVPIDVPGARPAGRFGHAAILDPAGRRMLVIGGYNNTTGALYDVWALALDGQPSWQLLPTQGQTPDYLTQLSVGLDAPHNRLTVMERDVVGSIYTLRLAPPMTWTRTDLSEAPAFQQGRPAIYDPRLDRFVMFGASETSMAYDATFQLGLGGPLAWSELPTTAFRPRTRWGDAAVHDTRRNRLLVYGGFDGDRYYSDTWGLPFTDAVTGTMPALMSSELAPGEASFLWQGSLANGESIVLERSKPDRDWHALAALAPDAAGFVRYDDRDVLEGARYGYRLRVGSGTDVRLTAETWVDIPKAGVLALAPTAGNPLRGELDFGIVLPDAAPARIEMLDTAGRRVAARTLTGLPPGRHTVRLDPDHRPIPGVYLIRLTQGPKAATFKAAIVR